MSENTIIGAAFESQRRQRTGLHDQPGFNLDDDDEGFGAQRLFKIRTAASAGLRESASTLINLRYAWRGYTTNPLPHESTLDRITLVATDDETTIGTMTVGFGGEDGLAVDELFADEVNSLRAAGHRVCEFTKLAMDNQLGSKRVLASLFHVAYIYSHLVRGFDRLLIEVNPRHVNYYRKILGFTVLGTERMNPRVNAPAVLLGLDFRHTRDQIEKFGGRPEMSATERSLYPLSFSMHEESGIVNRLESASLEAGAPGYHYLRSDYRLAARYIV